MESPTPFVNSGNHPTKKHAEAGFSFSSARWSTLLSLVNSFGKFFNHFPVENGNISRFAAGDYSFVCGYFLVYPGGPGIFEVGLDGGVAGQLAAFDDIGFGQEPGAVTDGGYGLTGLVEVLHQAYGLLIHAELIGVEHAPG